MERKVAVCFDRIGRIEEALEVAQRDKEVAQRARDEAAAEAEIARHQEMLRLKFAQALAGIAKQKKEKERAAKKAEEERAKEEAQAQAMLAAAQAQAEAARAKAEQKAALEAAKREKEAERGKSLEDFLADGSGAAAAPAEAEQEPPHGQRSVRFNEDEDDELVFDKEAPVILCSLPKEPPAEVQTSTFVPCPSCSQQVTDKDKFCRHCGAKIE
jgi:hypothetical protein